MLVHRHKKWTYVKVSKVIIHHVTILQNHFVGNLVFPKIPKLKDSQKQHKNVKTMQNCQMLLKLLISVASA